MGKEMVTAPEQPHDAITQIPSNLGDLLYPGTMILFLDGKRVCGIASHGFSEVETV